MVLSLHICVILEQTPPKLKLKLEKFVQVNIEGRKYRPDNPIQSIVFGKVSLSCVVLIKVGVTVSGLKTVKYSCYPFKVPVTLKMVVPLFILEAIKLESPLTVT